MADENEHGCDVNKDVFMDLFVHAPIGFIYEFGDLLPKAIKRGKSQVQISKALAQITTDKAAQRGREKIKSHKSEFGEGLADLAGTTADILSLVESRFRALADETTNEEPVSSTEKRKASKPVSKKNVSKKSDTKLKKTKSAKNTKISKEKATKKRPSAKKKSKK